MKTTPIIYSILISMVFCTLASSSVLSTVADQLTARKWTKMPPNTSLSSLSLHYSLIYWGDSGVWDPVNKKIQFVCGPGTCCANPAQFKLISYDDTKNTWFVLSTPFIKGGHSNDCNAFDPNTGLHYFALFEDNAIKVFNWKTWTTLPLRPGPKTASAGLDWFPDMNNGKGGLVHYGPNGLIHWYNNGTWVEIPGAKSAPYGQRHIISEYNPVHKVMWFGGGGSSVIYKMDAQLKVTRLKNAPFTIGSGTTWNSTDPVSGKHIVTKEDGSWWEFDIKNDSWSRLSQNMFPAKHMFHVPIPEYGVILYFTHNNSRKEVYLYKHSNFNTKVEETRPVTRDQSFKVNILPNPFNSTTIIRIRSKEARSKEAKIKIYDVTGNLCFFTSLLPASLDYSWNPSGLPNGIYLLKATVGSKKIVKKLLLQR